MNDAEEYTPLTDQERTILYYTLYNHEYLDIPLANYAKVQFGWTALQFSCIAYLKRYGTLSMSQLARYLFVSKQQATQLVSSLEKRKLAIRQKDQLNRRMIYVIPTDMAVKNLLQAEHALINAVQEELSDYTQEEAKRVLSAMEILNSFCLKFGDTQLQQGASLMDLQNEERETLK